MSETHCPPSVPGNTVADGSVKFQFLESMSFDPMSIHAHAAPHIARADRFSFAIREFSIWRAFGGCGEPSQ